jgi:anti-sigma factor RsiW
MTGNGLTCREFVELVTEYLEGTLPAVERTRFEEHLHTCQSCPQYVEQIRKTIRLTGKLSEESFNNRAGKRLLATFRDWKKGELK